VPDSRPIRTRREQPSGDGLLRQRGVGSLEDSRPPRTASPVRRRRPARGPARRIVVGAIGAVGVAGVLVAVVARHREEFVTALHSAPVGILVAAAALQLVALVTRTAAWWICVRAAGGVVDRRPLFRAASMGYLASQLNSQLGAAARIAALRRAAPEAAPRVPALIAAELPILLVEGALAALASVTLIAPLGLPWWAPLAFLAAALIVGGALRRQCGRHDRGFWTGVAVLRSASGRTQMVLLVLVAVFAQIARNWLMLHAVGVDASVPDATAVLIAMVVLSQLPVGPSVGAGAAVLILGADGPAATAAAGVLLTATGTAGALAYVTWAGIDRLWVTRLGRASPRRRGRPPTPIVVGEPALVPALAPAGRRAPSAAAAKPRGPDRHPPRRGPSVLGLAGQSRPSGRGRDGDDRRRRGRSAR
jgi:uncharacterized membrane protein YbhN (UPF0104 family)